MLLATLKYFGFLLHFLTDICKKETTMLRLWPCLVVQIDSAKFQEKKTIKSVLTNEHIHNVYQIHIAANCHCDNNNNQHEFMSNLPSVAANPGCCSLEAVQRSALPQNQSVKYVLKHQNSSHLFPLRLHFLFVLRFASNQSILFSYTAFLILKKKWKRKSTFLRCRHRLVLRGTMTQRRRRRRLQTMTQTAAAVTANGERRKRKKKKRIHSTCMCDVRG